MYFVGPATATQQTAQWDMQTAIVDAFKSILPLEARAQPAMSSGNSGAAISAAAHKPAPHPSPSSEPSHVSDLSAAAATDPVAAQAEDSQAAAGSVPPAVLAHDSQAAARSVLPTLLADDLRSAAQLSAALKAGHGSSSQANASTPSAAQGKQSQSTEAKDPLPTQDSSSLPAQTKDPVVAQTSDPPAAALPQPEPGMTPQSVSVASAGVAVTAQTEALQSAAVQAAKAKAAADIVAAVRAARKAAAIAMAPTGSTAAPADADSAAALPAVANSAAPAMTAAAAAAAPAAVAIADAPEATVTKAPLLPGAASSSERAAVTSASTADPPTAAPPTTGPPTARPHDPHADSQAKASPSPDTAAGLPSTLPAVLAASSLSRFKFNFSNSTATASTPAAAAAAATAVPKCFFPDPTVLLQSSVPKVPASHVFGSMAATPSLNPQALPASNTAAVVKPVSSTAVSVTASPGTAPVPVSLPGTTAGTLPIPSSLAAFLSAHAPRALLQGSSSSMPGGSFTLTAPMPHQMSAIGAVANSPGSTATRLLSERPASLPLGAGLSGTELPLPPHITSIPSPAPSSLQLSPNLAPGPDQAEGFTSIPASPSLFSPAPQAAQAAAKLQGSKPSKKRSREQAQLTQSEPLAASQTDGTRQIPFSFLPTKESQQISAPLAPPRTAQETLDGNPYPKQLHSDDGIPISKELALMRRVHRDSPIPQVGASAVSPKLRDVKSLVLHKEYRFNLLDICNAIGYFAIGKQHKLEIFLGDLHNSYVHQQQVSTSTSSSLSQSQNVCCNSDTLFLHYNSKL